MKGGNGSAGAIRIPIKPVIGQDAISNHDVCSGGLAQRFSSKLRMQIADFNRASVGCGIAVSIVDAGCNADPAGHPVSPKAASGRQAYCFQHSLIDPELIPFTPRSV
jgi:hypothetical protein